MLIVRIFKDKQRKKLALSLFFFSRKKNCGSSLWSKTRLVPLLKNLSPKKYVDSPKNTQICAYLLHSTTLTRFPAFLHGKAPIFF